MCCQQLLGVAAEGPTKQPYICWAIFLFPSPGCPSLCHSKEKMATKAHWQLVLTKLHGVEMEKGKFIWGLLDLQPLCSTGILLRAGKWDVRRCGKYRLIPLLKKSQHLGTASARSTARHSPSPIKPKAQEMPTALSSPWQRNGASSTPAQPGVIHIIFTQAHLSKNSILIICTEEL